MGGRSEGLTVRIGVYFDLRNPPPWHRDWSQLYGEVLELCEEAEHLGADSIWLSEHHLFEDGYLPQPLAFAAAVAARTRRARIGTAVLIAPIRPAISIAEQAAVVDLVSDGRLDLGLGAGYRVPEFEAYGASLEHRYRTTDERVRELRAIWAADKVQPPPAQARIPIWLGYLGPKSARRAGRLGEGLLAADPSLVGPYREGLIEGGHDPETARMVGPIDGFVSDDPERDWPLVSRHLSWQWDSYRRHMVEGTDAPVPEKIDPDRWRARGFDGLGSFLYGSPDEVGHSIVQRLTGTPVEEVFFWASIAGMKQDVAAHHIQLLLGPLRTILANV